MGDRELCPFALTSTIVWVKFVCFGCPESVLRSHSNIPFGHAFELVLKRIVPRPPSAALERPPFASPPLACSSVSAQHLRLLPEQWRWWSQLPYFCYASPGEQSRVYGKAKRYSAGFLFPVALAFNVQSIPRGCLCKLGIPFCIVFVLWPHWFSFCVFFPSHPWFSHPFVFFPHLYVAFGSCIWVAFFMFGYMFSCELCWIPHNSFNIHSLAHTEFQLDYCYLCYSWFPLWTKSINHWMLSLFVCPHQPNHHRWCLAAHAHTRSECFLCAPLRANVVLCLLPLACLHTFSVCSMWFPNSVVIQFKWNRLTMITRMVGFWKMVSTRVVCLIFHC